MGTMDVICTEKKMIDIDEPLVVGDHCKPSRPSSPPTELEPCEEFPILYGLLTAPKSFKPKNSGELQHLPQDLNSDYSNGLVVVVNRAQVMMQCPSPDSEEISMEEADSQNLDFCRGSPASSSSPQSADSSSSNLSSPDENDSPIFLNYLSGRNSANNHCGNSNGQEFSEDELSIIGSPGGSSVGDDCLDDDNIPTSTTSGFKRKACRLETAIGNIVRRRRVYKRPGPNNNNNPSSVPISMAPSSPTVSTTCVDPPPPPPPSQNSRGRSEILERILRSSTVNNPIASHQPQQNGRANGPRNNNDRGRSSDSNNNECNGYEPYAKLRDLLTMSEDQLVKRRRLEYGHGLTNNNNSSNDNKTGGGGGHEPARRREFSPPRNNILASLLQKGRAHELPPRGGRQSFENNNGVIRNPPALVAINNLKRSSDNNNINNNSVNDERPYKCSLCDLRFKKLPLLNRHVKTHSHIKRYVCRFCSHAFKRSDNLLAHMRTSCKGIKESDAKFAGGVRPSSGQILPSLLSSSSSQGLGQALASPSLVSRSQLEEALLNLRDQAERLCSTQQHSSSDSQLVSTTTASPPLRTARRQSIQPGPDFQSRHSKLLEILSGSPVSANQLVVQDDDDDDDDDDEEDQEDMPLPLSLKVDSRSSSPPSSLSPSSSSQSQFLRSHHRLYSNLVKQNELPEGEGQEEEEEEGEEENDNEQPLNLGSSRSLPVASPPIPAAVPSARSRDHPEIVSILSRQPKNVVMMIPELRKLVGLDSL